MGIAGTSTDPIHCYAAVRAVEAWRWEQITHEDAGMLEDDYDDELEGFLRGQSGVCGE